MCSRNNSSTQTTSASTLENTSSISHLPNNSIFRTVDLSDLPFNKNVYPMEQAEWMSVNEELRRRGFAPVVLTDQTYLHSHPDDNYSILNGNAATSLRRTLVHLLHENTRRKEMFKELTNTSKQMKLNIERLEDEIATEKQKRHPFTKRKNTSEHRLEKVLQTDNENKRDLINNYTEEKDNLKKEIKYLNTKLEKYKNKCEKLKVNSSETKQESFRLRSKRGTEDEINIIKEHKCLLKQYSNLLNNYTSQPESQVICRDNHNFEPLYSALQELCQWTPVFKDHEFPAQITLSYLTSIVRQLADFHANGGAKIDCLDGEVACVRMVEHFMLLFNVTKTTNVYSRMTSVFMQHYQMINVFNTLINILNLSPHIKLTSLVEVVGQLAKAKHLLKVKNIDSVIKNIEKYDKFYSSFNKVANQLFQMLGVGNLDEIVPATRMLQRFSGH